MEFPQRYWKESKEWINRKLGNGRAMAVRSTIGSGENLKPMRQTRLVIPNITVVADAERESEKAETQGLPPPPPMININQQYANNSIHTSKYNWITFLPKNLFEQFYRSANLYFLFIQILNWLPGMEVFVREIQLLPLLFVLSVTAIKDLFEDRRRHLSDKRVNNMSCLRYDVKNGEYVRSKWKNLIVGDLVQLSCNEIVPADILLLHCRSVEGEDESVCFVETSNLDGENNLKARYVVNDFHFSHDPSDFQFQVECEKPSMKLHKFQGTIIYRNENKKKVAINKDNLLLRDCILKNTGMVEGLVIYAGHETKALLNNKGPRHKRSRLEKMMNRDIIMCVVILLIMCIIGFMGRYFWLDQFNQIRDPRVPYADDPSPVEALNFTWPLKHFATFMILYQMIIPISLYVCIEMVKLGQIYMINRDEDMLDPITNRRCECRAWNITEDLGQIEYVFCDKTGTLTENMMEFQCCCIRGIDYPNNGNNDSENFLGNNDSSINTNNNNNSNNNDNGETKLTYIQSFITQKNKELHPNPSLAMKLDNLANKYSAWKEGNVRYQEISPETSIKQKNSSRLSDGEKIEITPEELSIHHFFIVLAICNTACNKIARHEAMEATLRENKSKGCEITVSGVSPKSSGTKTGYSIFSILPRGINPNPTDNSSKKATNNNNKNNSNNGNDKQKIPRCRSDSANIGKLRDNFESESPDEVALVTAAYACKYRLMKRGRDMVDVKLPDDSTISYKLLCVLPFDSNRKRMSVIVECPLTKRIILYTKGSDQTVFEKLSDEFSKTDRKYELESTQQCLLNYSNKGLRVLCMAKRYLTEQEFKEWNISLGQAEVAENRERALLKCYNDMESNLELLGATAIEDKLQYRVPEIISSLRKAGISIWVLTGDKMETAVSIAKSCSLFHQGMNIITITLANVKSKKTAKHELIKKLEFIRLHIEQQPSSNSNIGDNLQHQEYSSCKRWLKKWYDFLNQEKLDTFESFSALSLKNRKSEYKRRKSQISKQQKSSAPMSKLSKTDSGIVGNNRKDYALVIDGPSLNFVLQKDNLNNFIKLTKYCGSVLCCRVSPLQKAHVVKCVKNKMNVLTMAVGDGANDVAMIQTANIGVGVMGVEGTQAAMASDFSIPRFHYLERLILVHGNLCYYRLALCILYFFYKNTLVVFVLFFHQFLCGFSGFSLIDDVYLMAVNIFYTTFPAIIRGILDKDTDEKVYLQYPTLYARGRTSQVYTYRSFWVNTTDSIYQSLIIFLFCYVLMDSSTPLRQFGLVVFTVIILANLLQIMIETKYWNQYFVLSIFVSLGFFLSNVLFLDFNYSITLIKVYGGHNYKVLMNTIQNPEFYHCIVLIPILCIIPRFVLRSLQEIIKPQFRIPVELKPERITSVASNIVSR